jgi:cytochrome c-type biogenesis protein CcmH/NrfG
VKLLAEEENLLEAGDSDQAGDVLAQVLDSMAATVEHRRVLNARSA